MQRRTRNAYRRRDVAHAGIDVPFFDEKPVGARDDVLFDISRRFHSKVSFQGY